ncbi:MAG: AAA family ATPase [Pseudanabaena sp. M114S2SP2A07QC]|nr:AAA family ATPase [Pseudanabaena sp. M114S2SP2A07QC]
MLKSFQIINSRLFEKLEVKKLGRVNLIVGKNNSGKSTFLEAIQIYASNGNSKTLLEIIESRQENWSNDLQKQSQSFLANPLRHLFFGHKLPKFDKKGVSLGEIYPESAINLGVAVYQDQTDPNGTIRKIHISDFQPDEDLSNVQIFLIAEEKKKIRRLFSLDIDIRDIQRNSQRGLYDGHDRLNPKFVCQIVATGNMPNRQLSSLWDLTSLTDLAKEVISALTLIDSRVLGIGFIDGERDERIPFVQMKEISEPLPLKSMGDGMTRIFHIAVALVNAKNGILLIDEFENGLHWTVQPKVWDIIFQLAERLNVQIFATTHSRDCIQSFEQIWNKYPESGAFFRLDEKNGKIKATEYTLETLADSLEMDVEVR